MNSRISQEIILILEENFGGELTDPQGGVTRRIFDLMASTKTFTSVSSTVGQMDEEGLIVRDMPNLKRTTRIALNCGKFEGQFRPGRKSVQVITEQASRSLASLLENNVQEAIDAHVAYAIETMDTDDIPAVQQLREELAMTRNELRLERRKPREAEEQLAVLRSQLDQVRTELEEEREQHRIAKHNAEIWRERAVGRVETSDAIQTLASALRPESARALEQLMRETPLGR